MGYGRDRSSRPYVSIGCGRIVRTEGAKRSTPHRARACSSPLFSDMQARSGGESPQASTPPHARTVSCTRARVVFRGGSDFRRASSIGVYIGNIDVLMYIGVYIGNKIYSCI